MTDNAANAVNKLISSMTGGSLPTTDPRDDAPVAAPAKTTEVHEDNTASKDVAPAVQQEDATVSKDINPAVEHETIKKEHETREQKVVDKEIHQDHYHTTVQHLEDREVLATEHKQEQAPTEYKEVTHEGSEAVEGKVAAREQGFQNETTQAATEEKVTAAPTSESEHVHHHYHETVQPVIEKETIQPSVTHKTIPVKEVHQEVSEDHGVTVKDAVSVDDFKGRLDGEVVKKEEVIDGASRS